METWFGPRNRTQSGPKLFEPIELCNVRVKKARKAEENGSWRCQAKNTRHASGKSMRRKKEGAAAKKRSRLFRSSTRCCR